MGLAIMDWAKQHHLTNDVTDGEYLLLLHTCLCAGPGGSSLPNYLGSSCTTQFMYNSNQQS